MTSFQRDSYVYVDGYGYDKLTNAYAYGGPKLTIQTIESNFGVKVDRYAVVDYASFIDIIDVLGGIDLELTQDEIDYINYQLYKNKQSDTRTTITDAPARFTLQVSRLFGMQETEVLILPKKESVLPVMTGTEHPVSVSYLKQCSTI